MSKRFEPLSEKQIQGVERAILDAEVCWEYFEEDTADMRSMLRQMLRTGQTGINEYEYKKVKGKFIRSKGFVEH